LVLLILLLLLFWLGGAAPPDMGDMGFDFPVSSNVLIA
jgi:hypothetical protein